MTSPLTITVIGTPAPQGSKRLVGHTRAGRGILIESSAKVKPWRQAVTYAAREAGVKLTGPVGVSLTFTLPKPKSAPKKRQIWPDRKPDVDKTARSTLDALTDAGTIEDDARVVQLVAAKRYPNEGEDALDVPGCVIRIWGMA